MKSNTPQPAPLHIQQPSKSPPGSFLSQVKTTGDGLPSRVLWYGPPGVGKTSFWTHAPKPLFLSAQGESGLAALIDNGLVPPTPYLPEVEKWNDALELLKELVEAASSASLPYKTIVLDGIAAFERLKDLHVCSTLYKGDEAAFMAFLNGEKAALSEWRKLLYHLDRLRSFGIQVVMIAHSVVRNFKNPEALDYGKFMPDLAQKYTLPMTNGWLDMVMFATFSTTVAKKDGKAKGTGGTQRVVHTEHTAAFEAKNRSGLKGMILLGNNSAEAWANFREACKNANATNKGNQ